MSEPSEGVTAAAAESPETELLPPATAHAPQLAYSAADDDEATGLYADDEYAPKLSRRHRELLEWLQPDDELWTDADDAAYARGTVKMFVVLMAITMVGASVIGWEWWDHHHTVPAPVVGASAPSVVAPLSALPTAPPPAPPLPVPTSADDRYTDALTRASIDSAEGPDALISMGHAVCRARERGETMDQVVAEIKQANPGLHLSDAQMIADTAARYYCPAQER